MDKITEKISYGNEFQNFVDAMKNIDMLSVVTNNNQENLELQQLIKLCQRKLEESILDTIAAKKKEKNIYKLIYSYAFKAHNEKLKDFAKQMIDMIEDELFSLRTSIIQLDECLDSYFLVQNQIGEKE